MQRLEVSGAVRPIYGALGVKRLMTISVDAHPREHRILRDKPLFKRFRPHFFTIPLRYFFFWGGVCIQVERDCKHVKQRGKF